MHDNDNVHVTGARIGHHVLMYKTWKEILFSF